MSNVQGPSIKLCPVEGCPVEGCPVEGCSVVECSTEGCSAEDCSAEDCSAEDCSVEDCSVDSSIVQGSPVPASPIQGPPGELKHYRGTLQALLPLQDRIRVKIVGDGFMPDLPIGPDGSQLVELSCVRWMSDGHEVIIPELDERGNAIEGSVNIVNTFPHLQNNIYVEWSQP